MSDYPMDDRGWSSSDVEVRRRPTGEERFAAMTRAEQDAALGPETADLVRSGKVKLSELKSTDDRGRAEQADLGDVK
jgi:hypothetical protein